MFYENHSKTEVTNFIKNFNSADTDYKKETILKSYFGNSFSTFAKKAEELKNADFELQARKISKEEKLAFVNSYDFSSLNSKMHPNNSLVARNEGAYKKMLYSGNRPSCHNGTWMFGSQWRTCNSYMHRSSCNLSNGCN